MARPNKHRESGNKGNIEMKYIIKNCPAITKSMVCVDDKYSNLCQDITDCLMKQIVERADICLCPEVVELLEIEEAE